MRWPSAGARHWQRGKPQDKFLKHCNRNSMTMQATSLKSWANQPIRTSWPCISLLWLLTFADRLHQFMVIVLRILTSIPNLSHLVSTGLCSNSDQYIVIFVRFFAMKLVLVKATYFSCPACVPLVLSVCTMYPKRWYDYMYNIKWKMDLGTNLAKRSAQQRIHREHSFAKRCHVIEVLVATTTTRLWRAIRCIQTCSPERVIASQRCIMIYVPKLNYDITGWLSSFWKSEFREGSMLHKRDLQFCILRSWHKLLRMIPPSSSRKPCLAGQ